MPEQERDLQLEGSIPSVLGDCCMAMDRTVDGPCPVHGPNAAYRAELSRWVLVIVTKERAWLEERLKELKPGETWCHHEAVNDHGDFGTWSRSLSGHVLPPGVHCGVSGARIQYGPAPDPWPPTECVPERDFHVTPHNGGGCFLR